MNKTRSDISFLYNGEPDVDKAWEDLRRMLDKKLPVKKNNRWKKLLLFGYRTVTIFPVLIACSLLTYDYNNMHVTGMCAAGIPGTTGHDASAGVRATPHTPRSKGGRPDTTERGWRHAVISGGKRPVIIEMTGFGKWPCLYKKTSPLVDMTVTDSSLKKKKANRLLGFDAGAYYNAGSSLRELYPVVNIHVRLSEKSAVSVGIGINSPIHTNNFTPRNLIILNDTASLVKFVVTSKDIKKLTYIDLPVSFKYYISERWVVHAGAQLSLLQHFDAAPAYKAYNFQDDISKIVSPGFATGANGSGLSPLRSYAESYTVRKVNWRLIAGISYQCKGIGFTCRYQQSITPNYTLHDFGNTHSAKNLPVFTVGVYYSVR